MAIEALATIIMKKDREIEKQKETIEKLNRKIDAFTQYIEVYEECLKKENSYDNKNTSQNLSK